MAGSARTRAPDDEAKIIGMKNYSSAWINGSTNHKTSCVVDHASVFNHTIF